MAKLTEYPQALTFDANDILIKDGINGTKKITVEDAAKYFSQYTNTNIASGFSAQTPYAKGAYVLKDGVLYRFTENHAAGAWSTSDTTEIKLASDMSALAALLDETNAAVVSVEGDVASILGIIAPYVSATMTAPSNITSGEYVLANGVLYRATANIASGSTLTPNGNVVAVTIGEELFEVIKSNAKKADANGTYDEMTVGQSKQLLSDDTVKDQTPYIMRTSGGALEISDREKNTIIGGTIAWNQQVNKKTVNYTSENLDVASQNDGKWTATIRGSVSASVNVTSMRGGAFPVDHKVLYLSGNDTVQVRYKTPTNIVTPKIVSIPSTWTGTSYNVALDYPEGTTGTFDLYPVAFDLTQMFGSTIADYIYSLEQENAGAGVAWFKKLFPKEYYAYDTGSLQSVQTSAHKMVGFNAFDKNASDITNGKYLDNNGAPQTNSARKITGYIPVIGGQRYYFADAAASSIAAYYVWYDSEKNIISGGTIPYTGGSAASHLKTAPANAAYLRVSVINEKWDSFVVNLSFNDEKDGTYEPYVEYNYPLDSSLELRGIPELDENNKLRYNGDIYESDGTVTRKYAYAKFDGSNDEGWADTSGSGNPRKTFRATSLIANTAYTNMLTNGITVSTSSGSTASDEITCRGTTYSSTYFYIFAPESKIANLTAFKAWLAANPVEIIYLIEATTESAEPYAEFQTVSNLGTEEYIDAGVAAGTRDVAIPVGNITEYYQDLRAKLESAPDSPDDDGDYILRRSSGKNAYTRAEPIFAGKANTEGDYPNLIAGGAQQLMSTVGIEDQVPYNFRTSGGTADIGDREEDMVVGGTIAWNQLAGLSASDYELTRVSFTSSGTTITITPKSDTSAIKKAKISVVPDHVYFASGSVSATEAGSPFAWFGFAASSEGQRQVAATTEEAEYDSGSVLYKPVSGDQFVLKPQNTTPTSKSFQFKDIQLIDLTQMFGTTIADYIYSLEQANTGDGVAWFRKLFPKDYYAYDAGTLQSVQTSTHRMVGFNAYNSATGTARLLGGMEYQISGAYTALSYSTGETITPDTNGKFTPGANGTLTVTGGNSTTTCVHLVWDGEKDGTYEPYAEYNYPLDDSLTLRGVPTLDENNKLRYDGDTYASDGAVTRRYGIVDLGTLTWSYSSTYAHPYFYATKNDAYKAHGVRTTVCQKYTSVENMRYVDFGASDYNNCVCITGQSVNTSILIQDSIFTDAAAFKAAMSGVYLVYELATPTTESADPYTNPQIVNDFGTEEYVDAGVEAGTRDVAIPVGHETFYQANLRAKLEMSPDSPDGDGDYIVRQANGENTYVPLVIPNELPAAPSTDGTYVLHATVADGVLTYSWVANT